MVLEGCSLGVFFFGLSFHFSLGVILFLLACFFGLVERGKGAWKRWRVVEVGRSRMDEIKWVMVYHQT